MIRKHRRVGLFGRLLLDASVLGATAAAMQLSATVFYVNLDSAMPTPPYTNWATAARVIQDAVDMASPGDQIIVTNGIYVSGGRAVYGTMTNRVAVDKPLVLLSVNGPEFTVVKGHQVPGTTNGDGAIRCVYLTNGASLSGFTLAGGATREWIGGWMDVKRELVGGGLWCEPAATASNCVLVGNSAAYYGGGAHGGTLNDCTFLDNSAGSGGGAHDATLNNCTLSRNVAISHDSSGGGALFGNLNNCLLVANSAEWGGGACEANLNRCTLAGNSAYNTGGGAYDSVMTGCTLWRNLGALGGGTSWGTLNGCILVSNSAALSGGGASFDTLSNCTLAGNSAQDNGGGAHSGTLFNCIVYFNSASNGANYWQEHWSPVSLDYCCTTPLPTNGMGNITNAPLFASFAGGNLRLQSGSPCINMGNDAYVTNSIDLDGRSRIVGDTVDMGAYEFQGAGMSEFIGWLQEYGLPTDGSADATDTDADGHDNWQEWRCLTDPTNTLSALRLLPLTTDGTNPVVKWQSVAGVTYSLERSLDLSRQPVSTLFVRGLAGQTSYTDTNAAVSSSAFYRVGVSPR